MHFILSIYYNIHKGETLCRFNTVITLFLSGRYNTSLGLYGIYCEGEAETNIAHTALEKLLYVT